METREESRGEIGDLKNSLDKLKIENKSIKFENDGFKRKLNEMMNKISTLEKERDCLSRSKESAYNEEIDDLKKRLEISVKTQNELKNKLEEQRNSSLLLRKEEMRSLELKQNAIVDKLQKEINEQNSLIIKKDEELSKMKNEQLCNKSIVAKLIRVFNKYHDKYFQTVEDLISFMSMPKVNEEKQPSHEVEDNSKQIKELEACIREMKRQNKVLNEQITDVEYKKQALKDAYETKLNQIAEKNEDDIRTLKIEFQKQLAEEKMKNANIGRTPTYKRLVVVTSQLLEFDATKEDDNKVNEIIKEKDDEIEQLTTKVKEVEEANEKLVSENEHIKNETMEIANKVKERLAEVKELKENQATVEATIKEKEEENKELNITIKDLTKQLNKAETQLKASKVESNGITESLKQLYEELERNSEDIATITKHRDDCLEIIDIQNSFINALVKTVTSLEQKVNVLKSTPIIIPEQKEADIEFDFNGFPYELAKILMTITSNDGLDIDTRVKNMLAVISKWINNGDEQNKLAIYEIQKKIDDMNRESNLILGNLKSILKDESLEYNKLPEVISELVIRNEQEKEKYEVQARELGIVMNETNGDNQNDLTNVIASFMKEKEELEEQINIEKSENEKAQEDLRQRSESIKKTIRIKDKQISELERINKQSREQIDLLNASIEELTSTNNELLKKLDAINSDNQVSYNAAVERYENEIHAKIHEFTLMRTNLENEVNTLRVAKSDLEERVESTSKELADTKRELQEKTKEYNEVSLLYNNIHDVSQKNLEALRATMQKEIDEANSSVNKYSEELNKEKSERENERSLFESKMEKYESSNTELKGEVTKLSYNLKKLERENIVREESSLRAQKLKEVQMKAEKIKMAAQIQRELEDERNNNEKRMRSLFSFFAQNFNQFFDPSQKINEDSFRNLVVIIRKEIDKLRKQDKAVRIFLEARDDQTTEEALTKFIINSHPRLRTV